MNTPKPSIAIWIDEETQQIKTDFIPQKLSPGEYGFVLASLIVHISKLFADSNPTMDEAAIMAEVTRGIQIGLQQRDDIVLPAKAH